MKPFQSTQLQSIVLRFCRSAVLISLLCLPSYGDSSTPGPVQGNALAAPVEKKSHLSNNSFDGITDPGQGSTTDPHLWNRDKNGNFLGGNDYKRTLTTAKPWTAYSGGGYINIWITPDNTNPEDPKNKFVQLRGTSGIKQKFINPNVGTYVLTWSQLGCSGNAGNDNYRVKVFYKKGTEEMEVTDPKISAFSGIDKNGWTDNVTSFEITSKQHDDANGSSFYVAFIPLGNNPGYGAMIDNVNLLPIEVRDVSNNQVITDFAWIKGHKTDGSGVEPEMPKMEVRIPGLSSSFHTLWKLESRYSRRSGRDDLDVPAAGGNDSGVFRIGGQSWKIWEDIDFSTDPFFGGDETLNFKLSGSAGSFCKGTIRFKIRGRNPDDARCKADIILNQGDVWYAWAVAKHESADSNNEVYNQFANGLTNGGTGSHGAKGEPFFAPDEHDGWGLFQLDTTSGYNVTTAETWNWVENINGFLVAEYPEHLGYANAYVDSVKKANPKKFEEPQFVIKGVTISGRDVLALTRYNFAGGRSPKRLLHFKPNLPSGHRWSIDLPDAPGDNPAGTTYVDLIIDTYNKG